MSKKLIFIIAGAVLAIIVAAVFVLLQPQRTEAPIPVVSQTAAPQKPLASSPREVQPGTYVAYDETAFQQDNGTRLLFFHAPWCPQCQKLDADIKAAKLPNNLTIYKVDYDTATALRQKYGVTLQTTVVQLDASGDALNKVVAYDTPTYESLKQSFNL